MTGWRILAILLLLVAMPRHGALADGPRRVVSMNVCTDQLAMLIGETGQLVSVSHLARDPRASALAEEASAIPVNHGLAEEIFLLKPDLVFAGTFTTRTTVSMLRRLGIRVEEFAPESNFDDIRTNILRMGGLLDRRERAQELVREFDARLAALPRGSAAARPSALSLAGNAYTVGRGTLANEIIEAAGFRNLAAELGYSGMAQLPIETVILHDPDLLILGDKDYDPPALAQEVLVHPALRRAFAGKRQVTIDSRYWICGAPFTLRAADALARHRLRGAP
ncbi:MAG: ABC transporter substrate-binding protein [Parvibaculaceae bacterium]